MYHVVAVYFRKMDQPTRFKVLADTGTGALIAVLAFDWTLEQRKDFIGARVDAYVKGSKV